MIVDAKIKMSQKHIYEILRYTSGVSKYINDEMINRLIEDGSIMSDSMKTLIIVGIPSIIIGYMEHIGRTGRLNVKKNNIMSIGSSIRTSSLVTYMTSYKSNTGTKFINQIAKPMMGIRPEAELIYYQCQMILQNMCILLAINLMKDGYEINKIVDEITKKLYSKKKLLKEK